jgi:hypothetical protein
MSVIRGDAPPTGILLAVIVIPAVTYRFTVFSGDEYSCYGKLKKTARIY